MSASLAGSLSFKSILLPASSFLSSAVSLVSPTLLLLSSALLLTSSPFSVASPTGSGVLGALGVAPLAFGAAPPASFGLGGSFGDEVSDLPGAEAFALSVAPFGADLGVFVADFAESFGESATLCD